jgi:hypothetical protein
MTWQDEWKEYIGTKYACFRAKIHYRQDDTFWVGMDISDISNPEDIEYYSTHGHTIYKLVEVPMDELDDILRINNILKESEKYE